MPQETDRLKLPLPLGNENVTRESVNGIFEKIDAGVAIQADLDTLREAVSQMDIPDASLTQKGKVQLTNGTTSTSQTLAATGKAVNDARQAAITAAVAEATSKANIAETNAKNYADTSFRKPSEIVSSNLIKNSSGMLNLDYWKNSGQVPFQRFQNQTVGAFFAVTSSVSPTNYGVLDNEPVGVSPGGRYLLQAVFHTAETYYNSAVLIEVKNASDNVTINSLVADNQRWWHRKAQVITIPTGVTAIYLRLVVNNVPVGTHGFTRIKLSEVMDNSAKDMPYSMEMDTRALYEGIDSVKQSGVDAKNSIVEAINANGGSASTSDTWATLAAKIQALSPFKAGDNLISSMEGSPSTYTTTWRPMRGVKPSVGGTFRISFSLFAGSTITGAAAYARLYVNGVPRGTQRRVDNLTGGGSFTEDIIINRGDEIQLYMMSSNSENYAQVQFFRVYTDFNVAYRNLS